ILLAFSVLIYVGVEVLLDRYVDGRLMALAETIAKIVEQHPNILEESNEERTLATEKVQRTKDQQGFQGITHSIRIFSPDGRLVWKVFDTVPQQSVAGWVIEQVRLGSPVYESTQSTDGTAVRHLYISIPRHSQTLYVLQAETSLRRYRDTMESLVILLTIGSGTMLLLAWIGSRWLAQKVLTPIAMLSASAETISEAELGKRLTLGSPYQELLQLAQAFNSVMDRFQRNVESQRRFVDHAAHELRTPLTVMQGNLEVALLKARTSEEYREAIINNLEQVGRLIALNRSLLTLAKLSGDKPPVHLSPLALEPLIRDIVAELTILFDERRIKLSFESQSVPPILGDAQWLKQALINLLDNALRYTPSGGTVTVRLQTVEEGIALTVEDTGHGIEPEHLPHLFERFYRTDWARAKDSGGTGLGLPIVKEIVVAHGGTIAVTSQVDKGSIFTLHLPAQTYQTTPA
ncbi:MAG: sensor histidine kinase, partial [Nitrospiraceae bacterium]